VTGRPGSGKTTLAHALAAQIHCPAFCRDEFKEGFLLTTNGSHEARVNGEIYTAFFELIEQMLARRISLVVEAAFQHKLWEPKLVPLIETTQIVVIVCSVDPALARARFQQRVLADPMRAHFHGDDASVPPSADYDPPSLPVPTLYIDTSNGYDPSLAAIQLACNDAFDSQNCAINAP
jgi:predicted kinase